MGWEQGIREVELQRVQRSDRDVDIFLLAFELCLSSIDVEWHPDGEYCHCTASGANRPEARV
jgi:hypothetical protein